MPASVQAGARPQLRGDARSLARHFRFHHVMTIWIARSAPQTCKARHPRSPPASKKVQLSALASRALDLDVRSHPQKSSRCLLITSVPLPQALNAEQRRTDVLPSSKQQRTLMQETNQSSKLCRDGADCRGHVLARDALISEVSYVGVVPQRSSRRCCDVDMFLISPPSPCRLPPQPAHNQGLWLLHKSLTAPTNKPRWAPNAGRWAASSFHITKH